MDLLSACWEGMLMLMQNPPPHVSHTSISQKLRRPLLLVGVVDSGVLLPGVGVPPWAWGRMMGEGLFLDTRALMRCVSLSSFVSGEGLNTAGMKNDSTMKHTSLHIDWRFKSCKGIEQKRAEDSNFLKLRNSKKEVLHSCTLLTLQQAKIHSPNQWHALIAIQLSNVWFNQVGLIDKRWIAWRKQHTVHITHGYNLKPIGQKAARNGITPKCSHTGAGAVNQSRYSHSAFHSPIGDRWLWHFSKNTLKSWLFFHTYSSFNLRYISKDPYLYSLPYELLAPHRRPPNKEGWAAGSAPWPRHTVHGGELPGAWLRAARGWCCLAPRHQSGPAFVALIKKKLSTKTSSTLAVFVIHLCCF